MKYLRKSFVDEGDDWFRAIGKAYLFVKEQLKRGNPYAAVMVEASLVEQSVRFLLGLGLVSTTNLEDDAEVAAMNMNLDAVWSGGFAKNIERLSKSGLVSKGTITHLRKFKIMRNETTHLAFSGVSIRKARRFVRSGTGIMDAVGNRIWILIRRIDEGISDDNTRGVQRAAILALFATRVNEAKALREWEKSQVDLE